MGIPVYFKNIINDYKDILIQQDLFNKQINNLFFDLNCLIHPSCQGLTDEQEIYNNIYKNVIKIIKITNPKDLIYIAIDGVCPRSKVEQQKYRRFRSANENKIWDTNAISPGTEFMNNLNIFIKNQFKEYPIKIIFSDSTIPGEGEHKIMNYLKNQNNNDINIIHGLDADLIMLSMIKTNHIYLLRERTEYNIEELDSEYVYLNINRLKKYLVKDIKKDFIYLPNQNIINDYIFLCFFIGNDFIHNSPCINIRYGGLDNLLNIYNELQEDHAGLFYLIYNNKLDLENFKKFIQKLSLKENEYLNKILDIRSKQEKKFKNLYLDIYNSYVNKECLKKYNSYDREYERDFMNHLPIIDRRDELKIFNKLDSWQRRYYMFQIYHHHDYNPSYDDILKENIENICENYLESFVWTSNYYFNDCTSWKWFYKYHFAPSIKDFNYYLQNINDLNIIKEDKTPLTSDEQLKLILPEKSFNLLPKNVDKYPDYYYPKSFKTNYIMKRYYWEGHPILPEIII
jgi:5'-3' exoribonuclease 2